jgi:hypothetical protein
MLIYMLVVKVVNFICDMCKVYYINMCLIICDVIILLYICYVLCIYKYGNTPLIWSVQSGNIEMCKLLIDNGALSSINTPNNVNNIK